MVANDITELGEEALGSPNNRVKGLTAAQVGGRAANKLFFALRSGVTESVSRGRWPGGERWQWRYNGPWRGGARKVKMVKANRGGGAGCS